MLGTVISLFDHSAIAVRPWAAKGYDCYCFDILHTPGEAVSEVVGNGRVTYVHADLNHDGWGWRLVAAVARAATSRKMLFAWPPCEDMTVSGNRHLAAKRQKDPRFQWKAKRRATRAAALARKFGFAAIIENPVGALSRLWRKPDRIWDPCDFGGYLPEGDEHPDWPKYIAPRDAYTKKTGAWLIGALAFPAARAVEPEILERVTKSGRTIRGSRQFMYLGGKSAKTKTIRNLTPRGFALALCAANS